MLLVIKRCSKVMVRSTVLVSGALAAKLRALLAIYNQSHGLEEHRTIKVKQEGLAESSKVFPSYFRGMNLEEWVEPMPAAYNSILLYSLDTGVATHQQRYKCQATT